MSTKTELVFLVLLLLACGCSNDGQIPQETEIKRVSISLNDPHDPSYWNFQGEVTNEQFEKLRRYFSEEHYTWPAKWQGLAVVEIEKADGGLISVTVFLTGEADGGCYRVGESYLKLRGENAFYEDVKALLENAPD
jgi:hypothetical protein